MRESRSYGSVRGVAGDRYPYRDPHFANATGKRPPAIHENREPLKIGQWTNDNPSAHPKRSRPAKGHSR